MITIAFKSGIFCIIAQSQAYIHSCFSLFHIFFICILFSIFSLIFPFFPLFSLFIAFVLIFLQFLIYLFNSSVILKFVFFLLLKLLHSNGTKRKEIKVDYFVLPKFLFTGNGWCVCVCSFLHTEKSEIEIEISPFFSNCFRFKCKCNFIILMNSNSLHQFGSVELSYAFYGAFSQINFNKNNFNIVEKKTDKPNLTSTQYAIVYYFSSYTSQISVKLIIIASAVVAAHFIDNHNSVRIMCSLNEVRQCAAEQLRKTTSQ